MAVRCFVTDRQTEVDHMAFVIVSVTVVQRSKRSLCFVTRVISIVIQEILSRLRLELQLIEKFSGRK